MISQLFEALQVDCPVSLRAALAAVAELNEADLRDLERSIVRRYRASLQDQEWISTELMRRASLAQSPHELGRVEEILAMLEHVHDPLISGSSFN